MPIYEYLCPDCREKFEKLVLGRERGEPVKCPCCGCSTTEQLFSTFATTGRENEGACAPTRGSRFT